MRMILRSLTQHLKDQNWFAVGLDFAIVVIGVFIGIQVSNWNENRADIARANGYLVRLEADLTADAENIAARQEFFSSVMNYGAQALSYAESDDTERKADWPAVLAFFRASQIFTYYRYDATYDELKNAGELNLITNQDLRAALANYFVVASGSQENIFSFNPQYRETVRGLTPSVITDHIWENCHTNAGSLQAQWLLDCDSPISKTEAEQVLNGYLADPNLLKQLRFWMSTLSTTNNLLEIARKNTESLREQIGAELNN